MSPDVSVSRTYLDTVFSLPWNKETRDKIDLEKAKEIIAKEINNFLFGELRKSGFTEATHEKRNKHK